MHSRLCAFLGLFQGRNHRWPSHLNLGKPSENHWYQWLICKKNIQWWWSRAGKTIEKPSMAMVPWKKTLPSHRYKKMTIVEVYLCSSLYNASRRTVQWVHKLHMNSSEQPHLHQLSLPVPSVGFLNYQCKPCYILNSTQQHSFWSALI